MKLGQGNENHQLSISDQWLLSAAIQALAQSSAPPVILGFLSESSSALKLCFALFKHKPTYIYLCKQDTQAVLPHCILEKATLNPNTRLAPESYEAMRLKPNCVALYF